MSGKFATRKEGTTPAELNRRSPNAGQVADPKAKALLKCTSQEEQAKSMTETRARDLDERNERQRGFRPEGTG